MFEVLIVCVCVFSIGMLMHLAGRVAELGNRVKTLEKMARLGAKNPGARSAASQNFSFEGKRVGIVVDQDHAEPLFAKVVADLLGQEKVAVANVLRMDPGPKSEYDLVISGQIGCNGFSDVYYEAELLCQRRGETVCVLVEKPNHGDRPINLGKSFLALIREEAGKASAAEPTAAR